MSIRIRHIEGVGLVAICAARSVERANDIYLDDNAHHALYVKFSLDFDSEGQCTSSYRGSEIEAVMEREESNNPNRTWWDSEYASGGSGEENKE